MKYFVLLFILIQCPNLLANINTFPGKRFHLHTGILIPGYDIEFANKDNSNQKLKVSPNINGQITVGLSIKNLFGLGWGFSSSQSDQNIADKGKTKSLDFRFNFAFKNFLISTNYSDFEGLFINKGTAPFTRYSDMNLRNMSINVVYVLSPKSFSTAAMYDQTQRQEASGGSWLIATSLEQSYFNNHGQTFLTGQSINFGTDQLMSSARFSTLNLYAGGGYTFSIRKAFYISGTALIGAGLQQSKVVLTTSDYDKWGNSTKFTLNLAAGYNGLRFFSGLGVFATGTTNSTETTKVNNNMYSSKLFVGIHL